MSAAPAGAAASAAAPTTAPPGSWFDVPARPDDDPAAASASSPGPAVSVPAATGGPADGGDDELSTADALARARAGLQLPTLTPVGWVAPPTGRQPTVTNAPSAPDTAPVQHPSPSPSTGPAAQATPAAQAAPAASDAPRTGDRRLPPAVIDLDLTERALTEWALRDWARTGESADVPVLPSTASAAPLTTAPPTPAPPTMTPLSVHPVSTHPVSTRPGQGGAPRPATPVAVPAPPATPPEPAGPTAAEQWAAIRWRLDGGTLREVVDDRDELRELGVRLDEPLAAPSDNRSQARLLSLKAAVYRLLGELGMAAAASRLALSHAEAAADREAVVVAQAELAHVLRLRGEFAEADVLFEHAASAEVPEVLRCVVHENAGRCCFDQGRYMEALDHFARAIRLGDPGDLDLVERVDVALEAVYIRVLRDGWGPYPRLRREILAAASPFRSPS